MPDAHSQDDLAESGFEALKATPDPVLREESGFFVLT